MKASTKIIIGLLPFIIILFNVKIVMFDQDYYEDKFIENDVYEKLGDGARENNKILVEYLKGEGHLDDTFFSDREKLHYQDVRNLISRGNFLLYALILIIALPVFLLLRKNEYIEIVKGFQYGSLITIAIVFLFSMINFNTAFINFHRILFNNDLWIMANNAKSVIMFPPDFFYDMTKRFMINSVKTGLIILFMSSVIRVSSFKAKKKSK